MTSPNRDQYRASGGKMLDENDSVFDLTAWIKSVGVSILTAFKIKDSSGTEIDPATKQKQDEIKTALDSVGVANTGDTRINPAIKEKQTEIINKMPTLEQNGGVPVNVQDQTSEIIDLYMCDDRGSTNPTSGIDLDDTEITVDDITGAGVGDCMNISENGRTFQAIILSIVDSTITFNAPSDQAFTTSADVCFGEWNMNVNGASASKIYRIAPPAGAEWDIVRIIIGMSDNVEMDDGKFGGISSLTNGVVLRVKNGYTKNVFVVSDNGGFRERSFDIIYADKAPAGTYGFGCRRTFGGQSKNGVTIRLNGDNGDELQLIIQDDLTDLLKLAIVCQGHTVTD